MSRKMKKSKRNRGFTLLEMIISLSIMGIIILVISGAMRLGVKSMERGERKINGLERIRNSFNIIDAQVQSLFPFRYEEEGTEKIYFRGGEDSLTFTTNYSAWGAEWGYLSVNYRAFRQDNGKVGLQAVEQVLGRERSRSVTLFNSLKGVSFEYLSRRETDEGERFEWLDMWDAADSLPEKIRMHLLFEEGEYSFTFPVRVLAKSEKPTRRRPVRRRHSW